LDGKVDGDTIPIFSYTTSIIYKKKKKKKKKKKNSKRVENKFLNHLGQKKVFQKKKNERK
jgi:hypothetical protein